MNKKNKLLTQTGFTLIELLVVIAIIGVLTAITVLNYANSQQKARDVQRKNDLRNVKTALEQYRSDSTSATYPTSAALSNANYNAMMSTIVTKGYMSSPYPQDPKNTGSYNYRYLSDGNTYTLETCLENSTDPAKANPTASPCTAAAPNLIVVNP